jgi:hypothetical protein
VVIVATSETKASATETEVVSTIRVLSSVDYDAAARLALIVEAEAGVALVNSSFSARELEVADELLLARESEGGVKVDGSSEGEVPCASPSDYMNLDEGSRVLVNYKGNLYKATIRKHRTKSGKQEFQIHYDGNKISNVKWIPADCIKSSEVASEEDTYDHSSSSSNRKVDEQETKNTNKRKRAPRSLTLDGRRRRNPARSSRSDLSADKPTDQPFDLSADKPTDKPSDLSADKPTDQPFDLSADKPTDKPSDLSADKPTDKPTACQASVSIDENLAVGESVGFDENLVVGEYVGFDENLVVGESVGFDEGLAVGEYVGFDENLAV